MTYLQPCIGCVCLESSADLHPRECPGIERGIREEGGKRRRRRTEKKEHSKERTSDFLLVFDSSSAN